MKRSALLVGIERYDDPVFPLAEFAESDAADLAGLLRRAGGYAAAGFLPRPTARVLMDAAASAASALEPGDLFVFYFAGHAVTVDGRAVLVCGDARAARVPGLQDVVPVELLLEETAAPGVARIFIFDTARGAPAVGGPRLLSDGAASLRALAGAKAGAGAPFALLASADAGGVVPVLAGRRSGAFAAALADELAEARRAGREAIPDAAFVSALARRMRETSGGAVVAPWGVHGGGLVALCDGGGAADAAIAAPASAATRPTGAAAVPWYGFSDEYRRALSRQLSRRAGCHYGNEIEGVDSAALFEAGAAREVEWRAGVPLAVLEWPALIAGGRRAEIEACLGAAAPNGDADDLPYLLRLYYRDHDVNRARYELDKAHQKAVWLEPALLLLAEYRDVVAGRRYLAECSAWPNKDARFLAACARAWHALAGDDREAARCLEIAEQRALDSQDFEALAAGAADFFRDTRGAWRFLGRAESAAQSSRDWVISAGGWMRLFNDRREAERCLDRAERIAVAARDWMACATGWRELLEDPERAREDLAAAESAAHEVWEWQDCAERWVHLFNDETRGRRCLTLSEQRAQHFGEWRDCAAAWRRLLNETAAARECLLETERHASDVLDWEVCAADWMELLRDEKESARCRAQAERMRARR